MDTVEALLGIFPSRAPYLFMVVGVLAILAALMPFKVNKSGWALGSPGSKTGRAVLFIVGLILSGSSVYAAMKIDADELNKRTKKYVDSYFSYVTISGSEDDCVIGKCKLTYHGSVLLISPDGQDISYQDRIKTAGRILSLKTTPSHTILNPEQYPENPTYLMFKIRPPSQRTNKLQAQGEAVIENTIKPIKGKIGLHIPYDTDHVVFVVDARTLGFRIGSQVAASIESLDSESALVSGYSDPRMITFDKSRVFVVTASNVAANSSLYISWDSER